MGNSGFHLRLKIKYLREFFWVYDRTKYGKFCYAIYFGNISYIMILLIMNFIRLILFCVTSLNIKES